MDTSIGVCNDFVDVTNVALHDWVKLECRQTTRNPVPEGIFAAGGCVIAQVHVRDTYYINRYNLRALILYDSMWEERYFNVLIEDIVSIEILKPSVSDD